MSQARRRTTRGKRRKVPDDNDGSAILQVIPGQDPEEEDEQYEEPERDDGAPHITSTSTTSGPMDGSSSFVRALRRQPVWIGLAVASGACAAINGVFAKLTTTAMTSSLSEHIAALFSIDASSSPTAHAAIDVAVRGIFFLLNLAFNAAMWALFTAALTRADSTTRVSIVNVSANFFVTALLGWLVFGETLGGAWWAGAAMLAAGNVVIGRRAEDSGDGSKRAEQHHAGRDEEDADEAEGLLAHGGGADVELDDASEHPHHRAGASEELGRLKKAEEVDDPI